MNANHDRNSVKAMLFAITLLAIGFCTGSAHAQSMFQGKFTLPYEARWGEAILPAGDYTLSLGGTHMSGLVTIREADSGRTVGFVLPRSKEESTEGSSELLIAPQGMEHVVYSFRVPQLGLTLISDPALAREHAFSRIAGQTQSIPVSYARK